MYGQKRASVSGNTLKVSLCKHLSARLERERPPHVRPWHRAASSAPLEPRQLCGGRADLQVNAVGGLYLSSRPEEFHLRALLEPCRNLSIHTAPDVRPLPWHSTQCAKRIGFARRNRANQSRAPLVR